MTLYCDMDGVLADFDAGYERAFGVRPSREIDNVNWDLVRNTPNFFRGLPLMAGALELWSYIKPHNPVVLTGVPRSIPEARPNKVDFIVTHIDPAAPVITCPSKDKRLFCKPGDILIDDWEKYMDRWIGAGGVWITHRSTDETILRLKALGF